MIRSCPAFAGGILSDDEGRVLLRLRGDKKTWAIPGGSMELGESTRPGKREFFEETGIQVEAVRFLNVYSNFEIYPNGDKVQTIVMIYEFKALEDFDISDFHNEGNPSSAFFSKRRNSRAGKCVR